MKSNTTDNDTIHPFASISMQLSNSMTSPPRHVITSLSSPTHDLTTTRQITSCNTNGSHKTPFSNKPSRGNGSARFNFSKRLPSSFGIGIGGGAAGYFIGGSGSLAHASPLWPLRSATPSNKNKKDKRPRILILMSDTGGGHRASAEALRAGFSQLYGDKFRIDVVDLWTHHTPWPFNQLPKSYSFMVKYPFIWRFNFTMTQPRFVHVPLATTMSLFVGSSVSAAYDKYNPNLIISVHPLMQHVPVRVLRQRMAAGIQDPSTAFATVVTDLTTCHNTWFYHGVDRCYVATEETYQQALSLGLKDEQLRLYGLPIRPAFNKKYPAKSKLRKALGMDLSAPAVLLVGGGEGMGPVEKTVDALVEKLGARCQVVVVCGRNAKLVEILKNKPYPEGMHVLVKGFVDNMPELMCASDIIITKAGPGTISEALICGLPMVLNAFVPCQEEGNIPYVTDNGVGVFESNPKKVAGVIEGWLSGGEKKLKELSAKAKALGKPGALLGICRDLEGLIRSNESAVRSKLVPVAAA